MISQPPNEQQMSFLAPNLIDQLNPKHPLLMLGKTLPWDFFDAEFYRCIQT